MAIIIEDGAGLIGAESYAGLSFLDAYFTARGISAWTGTDTVKEQAARKATEYIDKVYGDRILGFKEFRTLLAAKSSFGLTANATDTKVAVIGSRTYTFKTTLASANDVLIGTYATDTLDNLVAAINAGDGEGTLYGSGTLVHADVSAAVGRDDTVVVTARVNGTGPNAIVTTTDDTAGAWSSTVLLGGTDVATPQTLSFPRSQLWDRDGVQVLGVPLRVRQATAEYALRALSAELALDPTVDATGRVVIEKLEKIGPIVDQTKYSEGSNITQLIKPYPAADMLLAGYLAPKGRVIRG